MRSLPPHPDAAPALDRLREGGLTLCSLTNSPLDVVDGAARATPGIADRFEAILSADNVRAAQAGARALPPRRRDVRRRDRRRDARRRHAWDCAGALAAGCAGGVRRAGRGWSPIPVGEQPDIVGDDLGEVASLILA